MEHHVPLQGVGGIVDVHDGMRDPFDSLKASLDQVVSALAEDLDMNVVRDHLPVGELAEEIILDLGSRRETDLDLLEAQLQKKTEHIHLLFHDHRLHQGLVSVAKVHGAPDRGLYDLLIGPLSLRVINDRVPLISFNMVHNYLLCCCGFHTAGLNSVHGFLPPRSVRGVKADICFPLRSLLMNLSPVVGLSPLPAFLHRAVLRCPSGSLYSAPARPSSQEGA